MHYVDTDNINTYIEHHKPGGCDYCENCLECAFSECLACRFDIRWRGKGLSMALLEEAIEILRKKGITKEALELALNLDKDTIAEVLNGKEGK